jgi:hypothetical protein
MELRAHPLAMDPIHITFARDASRRALLGGRLDDPVVPDSPSLVTRAGRALARARGRRPPARTAPKDPRGSSAMHRSGAPLGRR